MITIYSESCFSPQTGAAGWAADMVGEGVHQLLHGPLPGQKAYGTTMASLVAVQVAVERAISQGLLLIDDDITIAMRSTAPIGILRWLFPEAVQKGMPVPHPKKLGAEVKEFEALGLLREDVRRMKIRVTLEYVRKNSNCVRAQEAARAEMEKLRP